MLSAQVILKRGNLQSESETSSIQFTHSDKEIEMMDAHIAIMQLVVAYTCVGVFVATAIAVTLNLFNYIQLENDIKKKLHTILVVEVAVISVSLFSGLMRLNTEPVVQEVKTAQAKVTLSEAQLQATAQIDATNNADERAGPPVEALNKPVSVELKKAVLNAEQFAPLSVPDSGWVFLGHVNNERTMWTTNSALTTDATWPIKTGDMITVKNDVYIRKITSDRWHSSAPVISVATVGEKLEVVEVQFNSAKIGGFYVWVKANIKATR